MISRRTFIGGCVPKSATCFFREGTKIGCVRGDFIDLQNSPAGFGNTREEAEADLLRQEALTPKAVSDNNSGG
jgi:hypothetical protein